MLWFEKIKYIHYKTKIKNFPIKIPGVHNLFLQNNRSETIHEDKQFLYRENHGRNPVIQSKIQLVSIQAETNGASWATLKKNSDYLITLLNAFANTSLKL